MAVHTCLRCKRTVPVEDIPLDWEVLDAEGNVVVCGGCLTRLEQNTIVEEDMEFVEEMKRAGRWPEEEA